MSQEIRSMAEDLADLFAELERDSPALFSRIYTEQVHDYRDNREWGLSFELAIFNLADDFASLPGGVLAKMSDIIGRYDLRGFSNDEHMTRLYDLVEAAAGAR